MKKVRRELIRAIENGDLPAAERSLRKGADPNGRDERGIPPLFYAAQRADVEMVSALIRFGANPHAIDQQFGSNALGFMIHHRSPSVSADKLGATTKLLIAQGLNPVHQPSPSYMSPWWRAVGDHWCTSIVKAMLESGVDPNKPLVADTNFTPLMAAAVNRNVETIKVLLEAGADPTATTAAGYSAARLVEEPDPDDPEDWSPEATAVVLRLLRKGMISGGQAGGTR